MLAELEIDGTPHTFEVQGDRAYGEDRVLLHEDDDLTAELPWSSVGYTVAPFLEPGAYRTLQEGARRIVHEVLVDAGYDGPERELTDLHEIAAAHSVAWAAMIDVVRRSFDVARFPVDADLVDARVSEICAKPVGGRSPVMGTRTFCFRITRPQSHDNNPPHRDVWLTHLRNAVNIYVPLAGSNERTSLPVVPGSHLWKESEIERTVAGARVQGVAFTVPSVTGAKKKLAAIRPDPKENEVLVFSPYLVHGGAANRGTKTRVSLEMRFWREGKASWMDPAATAATPRM